MRVIIAWPILGAMLLCGCNTSKLQQEESTSLTGTSWQLVKFVGGDDTARAPEDRSKYVMQLNADGSLTARNRGRGTRNSSAHSYPRGSKADRSAPVCGSD